MTRLLIKNSPIDQTRCALCGARNECGLATGAQDCWCFSHAVVWQPQHPFPTQTHCAACLCHRCLMNQKALDRALEQMARVLKQHC